MKPRPPTARSPAQHPGFQAPNPFFATPEQLIGLARERFFAEGERPSGLVSEQVIQSWIRCVGARRDPEKPLGFDPVTKSRLVNVLGRNRQLLQAASAELDQLDATLAGTPCKAILTSHEGVVVRSTPTARGEGTLMPIITRVGVNLDEDVVGTNAPSVAARTGEACLVRGGEHFFNGIRSMQCVAAPVRHANGSIAGVLDISCEGGAFSFDPLVVVRMYATVIENRLFEVQSARLLLLRFQYGRSMIGTPLEGLAAVDGAGRIVWLNAIGTSLLGCGLRADADWSSEALLGLSFDRLMDIGRRGDPTTQRLPNGLTLWIEVQPQASTRAAAEVEPPPALEPVAPIPQAVATVPHTLQDASRAVIESTLASCKGNVARAARLLGVSRGLLYRRMQQWREEAG
ncbi:MAG: helix-turn-helix domain-containing protein [Hydrogenophaga sp.]|uniref:helix-turn-helix domain-containing protein n=1 Tax=Hydrogenophaga sp. TaxID=1904254 RepID=UPI002AB986C3|nr:helix-turn-helix domain-containing protein [Hydrogenophaga sp.]MDZ4103567.1 helix-turn-helix domain-containing protein [Hydrogenophaga sp.]